LKEAIQDKHPELLEEFFGKGLKEGSIKHDDITYNLIAKERQALHRRSKSVKEHA